MAQANIETVGSPMDRVKVVVALLAVVAGIVGFYLLADQATVFRVLAVLAGLGVGAAIGYTSEPGKRFFAFAEDSYKETRKVVWPTPKEAVQTTAVVFAFVAIMAVFLWLTDKSLELVLYDWLLGWGH
jgi:preprotein translocase subunit SecE